MNLIILLIVLAIALIGGYKIIEHNIMQPAKSYPNTAAILPNKKILVCAGDSVTQGNMSHDWVKELNAELTDYQVFNAGVNADLSSTLLNRLDDIIALNPNHVNILIGGNDIVAQTRILKKDDIYIRFNKINWGTQPTIKAYEAHLIKIIKRLKRETDATISIMSICILGEDLTHPIHQTVDNYNKIVKKIADTEGVIYLPVFEQQKVYLQMNNAKAAIPFEKSDIYIRQAALLHLILRWDWDKITKFNKHLLTFDNLHFNSKGASFIKHLLVKHLSEL